MEVDEEPWGDGGWAPRDGCWVEDGRWTPSFETLCPSALIPSVLGDPSGSKEVDLHVP